MRNKTIVPGIILSLSFSVLVFSSCNSSDNGVIQKGPAVDTVVIKQMQFNPAILTVRPGDTVVWINKDLVDHNITDKKSNAWSSDTLHVGKTWKKVISDSISYFCTIHPTMEGKVVFR